ncbi:hypothetical protein FOZ63_004421 [Perkinsus olseni]|uniref:Uncharacterized protein n=1 Tax=Perkinsus olseni TaxID=32597 RepID=A0A7J6RT70_PEROL|nr:hypothetical protein FOZ63_004421 [Perkinsus olseni]
MMDNEATVLNRVMDGILNKLFVLFHSIAMIRDIAIHYITVIPLYILRLRSLTTRRYTCALSPGSADRTMMLLKKQPNHVLLCIDRPFTSDQLTDISIAIIQVSNCHYITIYDCYTTTTTADGGGDSNTTRVYDNINIKQHHRQQQQQPTASHAAHCRVKYILGDGHRNLVRKANQRLQQEDVSSRLNSDDTFPNPDVALILNKSNYPFSYSNVTIPERLDPSYICYAEIIPVYSIDYISDVIASLRQYDYKQQRFGK